MSFSFGKIFKITIFGESHGYCVGVVVEGCPPGIPIDKSVIQQELNKRKPNQNNLSTNRNEKDRVGILSGVFNDLSTGMPILMIIKNEDVNSANYNYIKHTPRPSHADFTARIKYGGFNDYRGGGIFSGRITAPFVMAGTIAKQILEQKGIKILAHVIQIGKVKVLNYVSDEEIEKNILKSKAKCAEPEIDIEFASEIIKAKRNNDSLGGIIECRILGLPVGIGEPLFDSIESIISHGIFSIPSVKGVEFGSGFNCANMRGSEHNDSLVFENGKIISKTNNSGGILGGISNGMPVIFKVAFKPTPSINQTQKTINLETKKNARINLKGRYDPCIVVRAVPIVEAVSAIAILDLLMRNKKWMN